ncbi:MAG: outer membrane lipoprotein carrier protein LolA [Sandaracinaceae bacterium]|nr:outer membrane lipoprotein carrier protein LolA [Sandaracinaceae bacterium]
MRRTYAIVAVLLIAVCAPLRAQDAAPPITFESLMRSFAELPGLSANFREEKRIALLASPLVNEGTLHFAPPRRLARHITRPARSTLLISGDSVSMGDAHARQTLELGANPVARTFIESFVSLLAGNRAALERTFQTDFMSEPNRHWSLVLRPRAASVSRVLREIRVTGAELIIERIVIAEANGDVSTTTFSSVDTHHAYSNAEAERVFRIPGP